MKALGISCGSFISVFGNSEEWLYERLFLSDTDISSNMIDESEIDKHAISASFTSFDKLTKMQSLVVHNSVEAFKRRTDIDINEDIGLVSGCEYGCINSFLYVNSRIDEKGLRGVGVKDAMNCIPCAVSSRTAIVSGLTGSNIVNYNGITAALDSIIFAADRIGLGKNSIFAVAGADEFNPIVEKINTKMKEHKYCEGAASIIVHSPSYKSECFLSGIGKSFSPERDYKKAFLTAIKKSVSSAETVCRKIDLAILGTNADKDMDTIFREALNSFFSEQSMPYLSSEDFFGEVTGADGILSAIIAMKIFKEQHLPLKCKWTGEKSIPLKINNIMIADIDISGQASCIILSNDMKGEKSNE
jgi:3-oxoacyl-(acyl-carrier-protein) synthase